MRLAIPLLAALLVASGLAAAGNHNVPDDNGTTLPDEQEATQNGPRNESPVSWFQAALAVAFLAGATGVLLTLRRWGRERRGGRLR